MLVGARDEIENLAGSRGDRGLKRDVLSVCENQLVEHDVKFVVWGKISVESGCCALFCRYGIDLRDLAVDFGADWDYQLVECIDGFDDAPVQGLSCFLQTHFFIQRDLQWGVFRYF